MEKRFDTWVCGYTVSGRLDEQLHWGTTWGTSPQALLERSPFIRMAFGFVAGFTERLQLNSHSLWRILFGRSLFHLFLLLSSIEQGWERVNSWKLFRLLGAPRGPFIHLRAV